MLHMFIKTKVEPVKRNQSDKRDIDHAVAYVLCISAYHAHNSRLCFTASAFIFSNTCSMDKF